MAERKGYIPFDQRAITFLRYLLRKYSDKFVPKGESWGDLYKDCFPKEKKINYKFVHRLKKQGFLFEKTEGTEITMDAVEMVGVKRKKKEEPIPSTEQLVDMVILGLQDEIADDERELAGKKKALDFFLRAKETLKGE